MFRKLFNVFALLILAGVVSIAAAQSYNVATGMNIQNSIATLNSLTLPNLSPTSLICTDGGSDASTGCASPTLEAAPITATAISSSSATLLSSVTVAKPSLACSTWRIQVSYNLSLSFSSSLANVSFGVWDGSTSYMGWNTGPSNASGGAATGVSSSGFSSVTYPSTTSSVVLKLYSEASATGASSLAATPLTIGSPISSTSPYSFAAASECFN